MGNRGRVHLTLRSCVFAEKYTANFRVESSTATSCVGAGILLHWSGPGRSWGAPRIVILHREGAYPNRYYVEESPLVLLIGLVSVPISDLEYKQLDVGTS